MRILKFGGKSLSTIEKTQKICKYIKKIYKNDKNLIIIVSAMGDTTNNLINLTKEFNPEINSKRELDSLLSTGEAISANIIAIILNYLGIPAKSFLGWQIKINTMGDYQNSLITYIEKEKINECLDNNIVPVIAGFQGVNKNNDITTLGRGGSDTTAVALGVTFNTNVELYSDFNGLFSCDPRVIHSKKLHKVSLSQLERLSCYGSKIVCHRAVKIARENNLELILKSSDKPNLKGTVVNNIEHKNISICENEHLCEIIIDIEDKLNMKLYAKNVIKWLNYYKLYNFNLKNNNISLIVDEENKKEILNILIKNLNL